MKAFEIFSTGKHTSQQGIIKDYTTEDLNKIKDNYDPEEHEAPIVIGHPKTNAPAFGWIEKLEVVGEKLLAYPKQVNEQFSTMIKDGLFKKRSCSLTKDLQLNHVGFLGATAPAVKGLKDVEFKADNDFADFEFDTEETTPADKPVQSNSALPKSDEQLNERLSRLQKQVDQLSSSLSSFSQANLSQEDIDKIHESIAELRFSIQTDEFELMLNEKLVYGSVTPSMKDSVLKLIEFLHTNNFSSADFSISKFNDAVKTHLTNFINSIPKIIYYENFAEKDEIDKIVSEDYGDVTVDRDSLKVHNKALVIAKSKEISYEEAIQEVHKSF